jgi:hypothetical protein
MHDRAGNQGCATPANEIPVERRSDLAPRSISTAQRGGCFSGFLPDLHSGYEPCLMLSVSHMMVPSVVGLKQALNEERDPREVFKRRSYLLARSGNTKTQTTFSPNAITAFEKSHIRATAPGLRAGITTVSPRAHFRISSEALVSLSRKPADTGRQ